MGYAFINEVAATQGSGTFVMTPPNSPITVAVGNVLILAIRYVNAAHQTTFLLSDASADGSTPADSGLPGPNFNNYNQIKELYDGTFGNGVAFYWTTNTTATQLVFRCDFLSTCTNMGIYVAQYSGLGPILNAVAQHNVNPGTGTDAYISTNLNIGSVPCMGWGFLDPVGTFNLTPSAGTGWTARGAVWDFNLGTPFARAEDKQISVTGNTQATWTVAENSTRYGFFAAFLESLLSQTSVSSIGQIAPSVLMTLSGQSSASTLGTISPTIGITPGPLTSNSLLGQLNTGNINLTGLTSPSTLGTITAVVTGNANLVFPAYTISSQLGTITPDVIYFLDQGSVNIIMSSFVVSSGFGTISPVVGASLTGFTSTSTEGVIGSEVDITLGSLTSISSEGILSPIFSGSNVGAPLQGQTSTSLLGSVGLEADYALSGQTSTGSLGVITFSISTNPDVTITLGPLSAFSSQGLLQAVVAESTTGIPNVVGQFYDDALLILQQAGVYDPRQLTYFSDFPITAVWIPSDQPPSMVLMQSPPAGSDFKVNEPITLTLSEFPVSVANPAGF